MNSKGSGSLLPQFSLGELSKSHAISFIINESIDRTFYRCRAEGDRFTNFSSVQPTSKWVITRENRRTVRSIAFIKQTLIFNGFTSEMNDTFLKNQGARHLARLLSVERFLPKNSQPVTLYILSLRSKKRNAKRRMGLFSPRWDFVATDFPTQLINWAGGWQFLFTNRTRLYYLLYDTKDKIQIYHRYGGSHLLILHFFNLKERLNSKM